MLKANLIFWKHTSKSSRGGMPAIAWWMRSTEDELKLSKILTPALGKCFLHLFVAKVFYLWTSFSCLFSSSCPLLVQLHALCPWRPQCRLSSDLRCPVEGAQSNNTPSKNVPSKYFNEAVCARWMFYCPTLLHTGSITVIVLRVYGITSKILSLRCGFWFSSNVENLVMTAKTELRKVSSQGYVGAESHI